MTNWIKSHRAILSVIAIGLSIAITLNVMMLLYHYDAWTNPKVGFWTAFWTKFEVSGFDPYTYIVVSKWRPLYVISRHPLLSVMVMPLSWLNGWLMEVTGINCSIFIVAVLMVILTVMSWTLTYRIMRSIIGLTYGTSLLLTAFFFSFSHVMLLIFVEDHMAMSLPLLLLAVYLSGKAIKEERRLPLKHSLPLLFVSTAVTTTNCIKVFFADLFSRLGKESLWQMTRHFSLYLIPLSVIFALLAYQQDTTQATEMRNSMHTVQKRMEKDSAFAVQWQKEMLANRKAKENQIIKLPFVTNTDYKIDRLPSLVENIFGEGLILHTEYALRDSNKNNRPVLVRYNHWYYYAIEAIIVWLFLLGAWLARKERVMQAVLAMFLFDMTLHVGLNFASADVYIMTAHWAFVIPIAVAYLVKKTAIKPLTHRLLISTIILLTTFLWIHNLSIIVPHILRM